MFWTGCSPQGDYTRNYKLLKLEQRTTASISAPRKGNFSPSCKTQKLNLEVFPHRGQFYPSRKTQNLNLEISPHRAVRLMRIEMGGAFGDLLNEKGNGSSENDMGYVDRTLSFAHGIQRIVILDCCWASPCRSWLLMTIENPVYNECSLRSCTF